MPCPSPLLLPFLLLCWAAAAGGQASASSGREPAAIPNAQPAVTVRGSAANSQEPASISSAQPAATAAQPEAKAGDPAATAKQPGASREVPPISTVQARPLPKHCEKYAQAYLPSIWTDLLPWAKGISAKMVNFAARILTMGNRRYMGGTGYPGMAIAFRNGSVFLFRQANLSNLYKHHAREAIIYLEVFQDLARRHGPDIPDIELVLATNDVPPATFPASKPPNATRPWLPHFRYCRSHENPGILVPVWQLYELNYSKNFLAYIDTNFTHEPPWHLRTPKLYGRLGRWHRFVHGDSLLTQRNGLGTPRKWFTRWTQSLKDPRIDVKDQPFVPITTWRKYKYLIFVDGITFSSKLEKLMALGSALMVEQSGYRSFYQMQLRPFEHYVPFWYLRPQEALDALAWLERHDEEAHRIAQNAQAFVKEMLNKQALRCYWLTLFREYAKLLKYRPADVQHDTWIPVSEYLADFRANKPNYIPEVYDFANKSGFEFDDPYGVPES